MKSKEDVSLELTHQLREVFRHCETQLSRACSEYNVPLSYHYILRVKWTGTGKAQSDIANAAAMSPSLASQVIQKMCKAKLLIRKPNPDDARIKLVHITAKGMQLRENLMNACEGATVEIFNDITPDDMSKVSAVLESVQKTL